MSVKKNILKNGLATAIAKSLRIVEQLVMVPFFISQWGAEYYGEWLTLTIIPSLMSFSDLGFGTSAANKFLLQYASGDKKGAADTAKSGIFIISLVVTVGILFSLILILTLDYFHIFDKSLIERKDAIWSLLFLMIARILNFYNQFYEAYFKAARKAALSINLQSVYTFLNIGLSLIVLVFGGGVIQFALVNLIVSILFNPLYNLYAIKSLGLHKTYKGKVEFIEVKNIMRNGFGYLLSPVWQAIYFQGTTFVVRLTLGPLAVTMFNTVRTLTRAVNQMFNIVTLSVFPEFQFEIGMGNLEKARKIFNKTFLGVILLAVLAIIFLYFFGPWFYSIWTGKSLNPPAAMWNIFILGILFNAVWWVSTIVFQAFNKPYIFTIPSTLVSLASVLSTYYLSIQMGLTGAVIGTVVLDFILALYLLPLGCRMLNQSINDLITDSLLIKQKSEN